MKVLTNFVCIVLSYYLAVVLHEWGHGTLAWLFDYKKAFFDVNYGGIFLLHVDEAVPYDQMLQSGHNIAAALSGIAGVFMSFILFIISCKILKEANKRMIYCFFYWFTVLNFIPILQYFVIQPFSLEGDTGRFVQGLEISPLWVFIPGLAFVAWSLYRFLSRIIPTAYARIGIETLWGRRCFLFVSLSIMFLLIYIQGYNPLSDPGMPIEGKILALGSIVLLPILLVLYDPSRQREK